MTMRLLVRLFSTPLAYQTNAEEKACLAQGRSFQVPVNGNPNRTISIIDSEQQARAFDTVELLVTHGLGHRRMLLDPTVIGACIDHIQSHRSMREHRKTA